MYTHVHTGTPVVTHVEGACVAYVKVVQCGRAKIEEQRPTSQAVVYNDGALTAWWLGPVSGVTLLLHCLLQCRFLVVAAITAQL
jgi:hypothetical protein